MAEFKKLPDFELIDLAKLPPASGLLFYNGNKATEWYANYRYHHPYKPAAFHASLYLEDGLHLSVGKFKIVEELKNEFQSTRRIDAFIYDIPFDVRQRIVRGAYLDADKPKMGISFTTYGITDFLRFEPLLQWLPRSKHDICSENLTKRMAAEGVKIAEKPKKIEVAPWMIFEYALAHPDFCKIRTVWKGVDFPK